MLRNLRIRGMAVEGGPRLGGRSLPRTFALHSGWRATAATSDVPFCAAARVATAVVLRLRSLPPRRRSTPNRGCAEIPRHSQTLWSPANVMCAGEAHPASLLLARVSCARNGTFGATTNAQVTLRSNGTMSEPLLECVRRRSPLLCSRWVCEGQLANFHGREWAGSTPPVPSIACSRLHTRQSRASHINARCGSTR
jgi:hypothetical protein